MKWLRPKEAQALQLSPWHTQDTGTYQHFASDKEISVLNGRHRFTQSVIKAVKGEKGIVEPSYVYLPGISGGDAIAKETGVDYFSVPIELGVSPTS